MKLVKIISLLALTALLALLSGCATPEDPYEEDPEYSSMPWNTPQQWEGSRNIPGLSPGY